MALEVIEKHECVGHVGDAYEEALCALLYTPRIKRESITAFLPVQTQPDSITYRSQAITFDGREIAVEIILRKPTPHHA